MKSIVELIAKDLQLDIAYVRSVISRSSYYYKDYYIPKRNGGRRRIAQASPELKTLQYWVRYNILNHLPISRAAFAYSKGDSVKKHAEYHRCSSYVFHTDIKDFFPSVQSKQLIDILKRHREVLEGVGIWYEDICEIVSKICFRNGGLCIGTVSSPIISNIVMYDFDESVREYCAQEGYKYSRYADDIYISSETFLPNGLRAEIEKWLKEHGFLMNTSKTWFQSRKGRRQITGLIITNERSVSVGTEMRRMIKKMVYDRLVHGKGEPDVVLGYLAYLKSIEPYTYSRILVKYASYCDGDVIAAIKSGKRMCPNVKEMIVFLDDI